MAGWRRRRLIRGELRRAMAEGYVSTGQSLVVRAEKRNQVLVSTSDRQAIAEFRDNPQKFHILDVGTARALARVKAEARGSVKKSKERVHHAARQARALKMKVRSRRDLSTTHKRRLERDVDRELAKTIREEHGGLKRELRRQIEAGHIAIRVSVRKHWDPERKRRAERVAASLGTSNLVLADLLIQRAKRAGRSYDEVAWDAVQVGSKRPDFSEYVAQLDKQVGMETVTAGEAKALTEIAPGRFVDVDNELHRYEDEYRDFLENLARRGEIPRDSIDAKMRSFAAEEEAVVEPVIQRRMVAAGGSPAVAAAELGPEGPAGELLEREEMEMGASHREAEASTERAGMEVQHDLTGGGQALFGTERHEGPLPARKGPGPIERFRRGRELQRLAEAHQEAVAEGREFPRGQKSMPEYEREEAREIREAERAAREGRLNEDRERRRGRSR